MCHCVIRILDRLGPPFFISYDDEFYLVVVSAFKYIESCEKSRQILARMQRADEHKERKKKVLGPVVSKLRNLEKIVYKS